MFKVSSTRLLREARKLHNQGKIEEAIALANRGGLPKTKPIGIIGSGWEGVAHSSSGGVLKFFDTTLNTPISPHNPILKNQKAKELAKKYPEYFPPTESGIIDGSVHYNIKPYLTGKNTFSKKEKAELKKIISKEKIDDIDIEKNHNVRENKVYDFNYKEDYKKKGTYDKQKYFKLRDEPDQKKRVNQMFKETPKYKLKPKDPKSEPSSVNDSISEAIKQKEDNSTKPSNWKSFVGIGAATAGAGGVTAYLMDQKKKKSMKKTANYLPFTNIFTTNNSKSRIDSGDSILFKRKDK